VILLHVAAWQVPIQAARRWTSISDMVAVAPMRLTLTQILPPLLTLTSWHCSGRQKRLDDAVAAALDHQLDSNDAWLPTRRHTDNAVAYRSGAPKVLVKAARGCCAIVCCDTSCKLRGRKAKMVWWRECHICDFACCTQHDVCAAPCCHVCASRPTASACSRPNSASAGSPVTLPAACAEEDDHRSKHSISAGPGIPGRCGTDGGAC